MEVSFWLQKIFSRYYKDDRLLSRRARKMFEHLSSGCRHGEGLSYGRVELAKVGLQKSLTS